MTNPAPVDSNQPENDLVCGSACLQPGTSGSTDDGTSGRIVAENSSVDPERYFKLRAWRRGPWIPARIFKSVATDPLTGETLDRSPYPMAERNGKPCNMDELLTYGHPIDKDEYLWLTAKSQTHPILKNWQRWRREPPRLMKRGRSGSASRRR